MKKKQCKNWVWKSWWGLNWRVYGKLRSWAFVVYSFTHLFPLTVTWGWDQPMAFNITHWCLQLFFTWWHCPKGFIVIVGSSVTVATQIVSRATWTLISLNSLIGCFSIVAVIATSLVTLSFTIWLDCLFSALFLLGLVFWFPSFLRVSCYAFVCDRDWAQAWCGENFFPFYKNLEDPLISFLPTSIDALITREMKVSWVIKECKLASYGRWLRTCGVYFKLLIWTTQYKLCS